MANITQKQLKELLHYDEHTGVFTWIKRVANCIHIGDIADSINDKGYICVKVSGKSYKAHRLAWLYMYGAFPEYSIDHEDQVKHHNWIKNLREVDNQTNCKNRRVGKNNSSGCVGVSFQKKDNRWRAYINSKDGKTKHLGMFIDLDNAIAARKSAEVIHGYHKNHGVA